MGEAVCYTCHVTHTPRTNSQQFLVMKIYMPEPVDLIRLQIVQQNAETQYLTLYETTRQEVEDMIQEVLKEQNLSPLVKGRRTSIQIREAKGGKNGKSKSVSFFGIDPSKMYQLIKKHVNKKK